MANELMDKTVEYEVNGENIKLSGSIIKSFLVRGSGKVTDQEVVMFLQLCQYQKLNPFLNEAYLVKFGSAAASIITSKEAFMKRAENNEHYDGFEAGIVVERNNEMVDIEGSMKLDSDKLIGGWAKVYRNDRTRPFVSKVSLKEFDKGQSTWKQMPQTMIRKTAIVNGLREAFPETLGSLYTEDDKQFQNGRPVTKIDSEESDVKTEELSNKLFKKEEEVIEGEVMEDDVVNEVEPIELLQ